MADFARFLLGRALPNDGFSASQLNMVAKKLHAQAQKARQKGTASKEGVRQLIRVRSNPDIKPLGISR